MSDLPWIKWITRHDNSDATATYDIEFRDGLTFEELIKYILSRNEWGTVYFGHSFDHIFDYRDNTITKYYEYYDEKLLKKTVKEISATGGWGLMDFDVVFETTKVKVRKKNG